MNIFSFDDYREFLKALIRHRKKNGQIFSYRWFSQRAGLTSPNFLNLVIKGHRHLSSTSIEKVIEIFHLTKDEGNFFRNLVYFNKSKTLTQKEHFASQLLRSRKFLNEHPLSKEQFEYYSEWYNIPTREILSLKAKPNNEEEISQTLVPSISKQEAKNALEKLMALGLVEFKEGRYWTVQESVSTGHKFSNFGVVQYHKKMMSLAAEALDRFSSAEREISSVTIGLSEKTFFKVKKEIEDFRSRLMAMAESDSEKERIYQLNFQLFPLSKKKETGK